MAKALIVGFGNLLMGDDGAGIHLIRKLAKQPLPAQVELLDGGVNSFAALTELRYAAQGIFIDTMIGGGVPGDIYRLTDGHLDNQSCSNALSVHEFSLIDSLRLFKQMGEVPSFIIYGIEPATIELGMELSPQVTLAVDKVIAKIMEDLNSIM
ncbi:Hydrogenase 2 maturation protease [bioreactor metagenome]|uniref:Hydrogenase 2 maturation protease n=1 Tax=bioreactor metagenome TaxID=1076179 RepID=A0A644TG08_9ZZZZ|nr:hydrogenase maturation protease [Negativicutes bacterium]